MGVFYDNKCVEDIRIAFENELHSRNYDRQTPAQ